jgi:hypothetical protein
VTQSWPPYLLNISCNKDKSPPHLLLLLPQQPNGAQRLVGLPFLVELSASCVAPSDACFFPGRRSAELKNSTAEGQGARGSDAGERAGRDSRVVVDKNRSAFSDSEIEVKLMKYLLVEPLSSGIPADTEPASLTA